MPVTINGTSGSITGASIPVSSLGTHGILQIVSAEHSTQVSTSSTSYVATNLTVNITPSSTSNKILVLCTLHISTGSASANQTNGCQALIKRDGTGIGVGDAAGNRVRSTGAGIGSANTNRLQSNVHMTFLDSPSSTSALSYTAHIKPGFNGTQYVNLNREQSDGDLSSVGRSASSITLMEVAA